MEYRLIIGLGNPGEEYEFSRHNAGFWVLDKFFRSCRHTQWETYGQSHVATARIKGQRIYLLKPMTFMNLSGTVSAAFMNRHSIHSHAAIVIHDDLDLDLGRIKVKVGGSSGGHKGIESLIREIGSPDFCRVKVGIGRPAGGDSVVGHVLSPPENVGEATLLAETVDLAVEALKSLLFEGANRTMNRYNQRNKKAVQEEDNHLESNAQTSENAENTSSI